MLQKEVMEDLEVQENNSIKEINIPISEKYTLSLAESAEYFGIGYKKLSKFINEHKDEKFVLWNGSRAKIKRKLFEKYIDEHLDVI